MVRKKRESGKDSFDLAPEKVKHLNDDRAYTCAMCSYALQQERRKAIIQRKKPTEKNLVSMLTLRPAKRTSQFQ